MVHSTINCLITDRTGGVWSLQSLQKAVKELSGEAVDLDKGDLSSLEAKT